MDKIKTKLKDNLTIVASVFAILLAIVFVLTCFNVYSADELSYVGLAKMYLPWLIVLSVLSVLPVIAYIVFDIVMAKNGAASESENQLKALVDEKGNVKFGKNAKDDLAKARKIKNILGIVCCEISAFATIMLIDYLIFIAKFRQETMSIDVGLAIACSLSLVIIGILPHFVRIHFTKNLLKKELGILSVDVKSDNGTDSELIQKYIEEDEKNKEAFNKARQEDFKKPYDPECILEIRHMRKTFPLKKSLLGKVQRELVAVDDVSFKLHAGETLGIVGESGCGKTTLGRAILKLHQPSGGQIIFDGEDITNFNTKEMRKNRTKMQIIFQDPYSSLPPRSTVGDILSEPVQVHNIVPKGEVKDYVLKLMDKCGLRDYYFERYPHEFSGGQRQRICIARALSVNPKLVICDEPVSALDVSIQAQIINLLKELQRSMNLTYIFISHDLSVVKFISDKIGVMYLGSMVEFGNKEDIFANPIHPYTKALFSAIPNPNPDVKMNRIVLKGDIPSPANPPSGCRFHTRCPHATEKCKYVTPTYREYENGHFAACHLLDDEK